MKIISWNCNMAYAKKQQDIVTLQPDMTIIQECSEKDITESKVMHFYPKICLKNPTFLFQNQW